MLAHCQGQSPKGSQDRSKRFGSHGQRLRLHDGVRTGHSVGPADLSDGLEAGVIIEEVLAVQHHPCPYATGDKKRTRCLVSAVARELLASRKASGDTSPKRRMSDDRNRVSLSYRHHGGNGGFYRARDVSMLM